VRLFLWHSVDVEHIAGYQLPRVVFEYSTSVRIL